MIDRNHDLPIARQAKALNISRSAVYYKPRPVSTEDMKIMRRIDELHLYYLCISKLDPDVMVMETAEDRV